MTRPISPQEALFISCLPQHLQDAFLVEEALAKMDFQFKREAAPTRKLNCDAILEMAERDYVEYLRVCEEERRKFEREFGSREGYVSSEFNGGEGFMFDSATPQTGK